MVERNHLPCLLSTSILGDRYHKFMTESRIKACFMAISANNWLDFSDVLEWQSEHLKPRVTSVHHEILLGKLPYSACKRPI